MVEKVLTDNAGEKITVSWDGTRFALVKEGRDPRSGLTTSMVKAVIILNPREMLQLINFAGTLGEE